MPYFEITVIKAFLIVKHQTPCHGTQNQLLKKANSFSSSSEKRVPAACLWHNNMCMYLVISCNYTGKVNEFDHFSQLM